MRLFFAITLDRQVRDHLGSVTRQLRQATAGGFRISWVRPESLHVTLKFIGDWPDERLPQLTEAGGDAAADIDPFDLTIGGLGCFPPGGGRPRVIWAGLQEHDGMMQKLTEHLEQLCCSLGTRQEHRLFRPHLTLGRVKSVSDPPRLREILDAKTDFAPISQGTDRLTLFSSVLRPKGAEYVVIANFPFGIC